MHRVIRNTAEATHYHSFAIPMLPIMEISAECYVLIKVLPTIVLGVIVVSE